MKNGFFTACSLRGGMFTGRTAVRGAFGLTFGTWLFSAPRLIQITFVRSVLVRSEDRS